MHSNRKGFTLIELMIVIAIIAALVAATSIAINIATKQQRKTTTQHRLNAIGTWLDNAKSPDNFGRYPLTSTLSLVGPGNPKTAVKYGVKVGQPDETNIGIETVFIAMQIPGITGGTDLEPDAYGNTDNDEIVELVGDLKVKDMSEILDGYGNPLVYFHNRDYKDPKDVARYMLSNGNTVKVSPRVNEKTGKFFRPSSFQLFSLGPDGEPGTDDDIHFGE